MSSCQTRLPIFLPHSTSLPPHLLITYIFGMKNKIALKHPIEPVSTAASMKLGVMFCSEKMIGTWGNYPLSFHYHCNIRLACCGTSFQFTSVLWNSLPFYFSLCLIFITLNLRPPKRFAFGWTLGRLSYPIFYIEKNSFHTLKGRRKVSLSHLNTTHEWET